jgi:predicted short-subunit dehydrogenase-like oxidoreductase (DUF2520 family)
MDVAEILRWRLVLAGPGRAGRAFVRSWRAAGGRLQGVIGRDRAGAERAARDLGEGKPATIAEASGTCDLLVLSVADDAIEATAAALAQRVACRVAFHFSGAWPSDLLAPFSERGAAVGSMHPLRAFAGNDAETWRDAFVVVEGDSSAVEAGVAITSALGARGRPISSDQKPLYHAAATLAAGGSLALVSLAVGVWKSLGIPENEARAALAGLGSQALAALVDQEFREALTGPIARRDVGTVHAHREALAAFPQALAVYVKLAEETLVQTPGRGRDDEVRAALEPSPPKS